MKKHISFISCFVFISLLAFYACSEEDSELITPVLELGLSNLEFSADENSRTVDITCNIRDWNFELENPADASWLQVSKDGGVKIMALVNNKLTPRRAKIIVYGDDLKEEIIVNQAGITPVFGLSNTSVRLGIEGGSHQITVNEGSNLGESDWKITPGANSEWLKFTKSEAGIELTASENETDKDRTATLVVTSQWVDDIIISVSQKQGVGNGLVLAKLTVGSFSSNAADPSEGKDFGLLLDGNLSTYWHTSWRGDIPLPHYLQVDLGEEVSGNYALYYGSRAGSNNNAHNPVVFDLLGSITGGDADSEWFVIRSFEQEADGLPVGAGKEYFSAVYNTGKTYRYIRLNVGQQSATGRDFWSMSEFRYFKSGR